MSELQEQAFQMISELSDDNVSFLIEIMKRIMPQKSYVQTNHNQENEESMLAFQRLN